MNSSDYAEHRGAQPVRLHEYRPPDWTVTEAGLEFDLDVEPTHVRATLRLRRDAQDAKPLRLDGEKLDLREIRLDGRLLGPADYTLDEFGLTLPDVADGSVVETHVCVHPQSNTELQGLYLSGTPEQGFLLTQCEAEGFRRITYFPDRPDILCRYTVTLRADKTRFPVLLAGGNPDGSGNLEHGRHWARFVDPHPRASYLFAVVAGHLEMIERDYNTAEGRAVKLRMYAESQAIEHCRYALDALERAMRWDEANYGRNYDLDVFNIVATDDFNMGAMENKGLNIFNTKYILADPETTTDEEHRHIEAVVGHEYFHNWSGNRVTCRDWFQLSLKEGFTVFREQSFSAEMNAAALKRIEDVGMLRRVQFPEDAGPLAHPVRPEEYREINNFYTATVYEKGAELVRMLAGRLGTERFRRGTDLYFSRNDGQAVTIEDFLDALAQANELDLSAYLDWYRQAGTPRVKAHGAYDAEERSYTLRFSQSTPRTPGQSDKHALPIPIRMALYDADGQSMELKLADETASSPAERYERVLILDRADSEFRFREVRTQPIPSLLRDFSAPVILDYDYLPGELEALLRHEDDGFNRWEISQRLAGMAFDEILSTGAGHEAGDTWIATLGELLDENRVDPSLLAALLTPPSEVELGERCDPLDPAQVHGARRELERRFARSHADMIERTYAGTEATGGTDDGRARGLRRLRARLLTLLVRNDIDTGGRHAQIQFQSADNMTDRIAALSAMVLGGTPQAETALSTYRERYARVPLAMDKWFSLQARAPGAETLERVRTLTRDVAFKLRNPNRVNALLGSYARGNPAGFHRVDGEGYRFLGEMLARLDELNPQNAARLATAFHGWKRLEPLRREQAHEALADLATRPSNSRDIADIVQRELEG